MAEVALVTGGARRIGRAIVERLAANGYAVAIHCGRARDEADALAAGIVANGGRAAVLVADLVDPDAVAGLLPAAEAALGPVTLLVNNASSFLVDEVTAIDVPTWNRQFSINLRAPSVLAGALANRLPEGRQGAIVNIIDQRVWKLTPQYYSYTLTKAALLTATTTWRRASASTRSGPARRCPTPMTAPRRWSRRRPERCCATRSMRARSRRRCSTSPAPARSPGR